MPRIIDYPQVVEQAAADGLVSLYPNSGAFGFAPGATGARSGGSGGRFEHPPGGRGADPAGGGPLHRARLAAMAARAWRELLPGEVWALPKSHWAYELQFGSHEWMPGLLREVGSIPQVLELGRRRDGTGV